MLLTLLKVTFFFGVILAAALGAMHLAETDRVLRIVFDGVEYTLRPLQALALALLVVIAGWIIVQLLRFAIAFVRFVAGDETAIDRYFARRRERKGYHALAEGMLAVASGDVTHEVVEGLRHRPGAVAAERVEQVVGGPARVERGPQRGLGEAVHARPTP